MAEQAAAGLQTSTGEVAAARRLDAEDATMRQVLAWAMEHDAAMALRLAVALAPWWLLRGRLAGEYPLLREAAGRAEAGSDGWCAAQFWLGRTALFSADLAGALGHFTAVRDAVGDRGPSRALADCLAGRSVTLANMGRLAEAADDGRRALALARELGYPAGETLALADLSIAALTTPAITDGAVRLARQAEQITADIPGWIARMRSYVLTDVLTEAGDLAAAERVCAAGLARSRDAGDLWNLALLLSGWRPWTCGRAAPRTPRRTCGKRSRSPCGPAAGLSCSTAWTAAGTCAPRPGAAPRPSRCGPRAPRSDRHEGLTDPPRMRAAGRNRCARPGRRSGPPGPGRPRNAARR